MLRKKFWIPLVLVLIGAAIGGRFWQKHASNRPPVKVYKPLEIGQNGVPEPEAEILSDGKVSSDDATYGESSSSEEISPDGSTDRETHIDGVLPSVLTDRESFMSSPEAPQLDTDSEEQIRLYRQRVEQYIRDSEKWKKAFRQAFEEKMQVSREFFNLTPNSSPEDMHAYFSSLSVAEKEQLHAKVLIYMERLDAADKKLDAVEQAQPVFPKRP